MYWVLILLVALIAIPVVIERMRAHMGPDGRQNAPGKFATLSRGVVHYAWLGPVRGPVCVCIHGLTTSSYVWGGLSRGLALLGFRVLIFDHYGRGYSDRPTGPHDDAFYLTELEELLTHENVGGDITLIGYSMGGAIATLFAAAHPDRLRQLILLAPAGMGLVRTRLSRFIVQTPVIGDWLMLALFPRQLRKGIRTDTTSKTQVENIGKMQLAELNRRGFVPAVLSSLRGVLNRSQKAEHQIIHRAGIPVLAIWGREDTVIAMSSVGLLAEWSRNAHQEVIDGATHALPYTHADQVLQIICDNPPKL
ncbi:MULTISPECIES: alpha/beta fold hydrolase [Roseobacteraceae]|uniref:4,5:9,10-diseco-3-hydroxy-5,9, 17-trioxoandrosta-1(10),2-diene-4-oate hydrolase n=1 Tax=Pseudosulfitobacter pseudonitzschiae TaxID=1402135 RepID=A0A221K565_9RHOB|nr:MULTISPECIES: alpha/beta hydrolase [Roseobacteraceae]ASM74105.1 4,5:9,10-diseco-3-hydroxy-5,9, 17-trioxoandrosta-1(10),2-diene-4-oate hydrolase [Pseudosulfitobacter pseudonitzschiae]